MRRYAALLLLVSLGPLWTTEVWFRIHPQAFYFRPWEYFDDLAYRTDDLTAEWDGMEYGDRTRDNLFLHQEGRKTRVTTDPGGFRSIPRVAAIYPVVMHGESNLFGSGCGDSETLPWKLSDRLGLPVFNASRVDLYAFLGRKSMPRPTWVVDCVIESWLDARFDISLVGQRTEKLKYPTESAWTAENAVPVERYRFQNLLGRWCRGLWKDLGELHQAGYDPGRLARVDFQPYRRTSRDLEEPIRLIVKRKKWMDRHGIRYLFIPLPSKWVIEGPGVDPFTSNYTRELVERLRREGVPSIDLDPAFRAQAGKLKLFYDYDTHLNAAGFDLAAGEISDFLRGQDLSKGR